MKKALTLLLLFTLHSSLFTLHSSLSTCYAQEAGQWYSLRSGTKALIIENGSMENGAKVTLWTPTDVPSQLWRFEQNEDGTYYIHGGYQDEYLCTKVTPAIGGVLAARTKASRTRLGTWILEPVAGKTDTYYIYAKEKIGLLAASESADGIYPALVDPANPTGKTEWKLVKYNEEVPTEYNEQARDAIVNGFMNQYYHTASSGHVLGGGGFWGDAEMIETLLDGFETTGDKTYQTYVTQLITNFINRCGNDWTSTGKGWPRSNEYNDDITWMVLSLIRAYKYFKVTSYLTNAQNNFDKMWARAIEPGGTLRWKEASDTQYGSNSCINCPAIIAACYLYEITEDEGYLDKAKSLWDAQYKYLCDQNDGHVWDSGSWDNTYTTFKVGNYWGSTYNQGTMLGACMKLWKITGDVKYKNYAAKVYNWSYNNLTANTSGQPRIISACQTATGDLCGFKGILVRYVRMYGEMLGKEDALEWLEKNAWYAYQNQNSKGVIWSKWLTKTPENFKDGDNDFTNDAFGASTAVSVALNAHVNRVFNKDAFSTIEAQWLDDAQWLQLYGTKSDGDTPNTTSSAQGAWICFKNVNFGSGADGVNLRVKGNESTNWTVYVDNLKDENKLASSGALTTEWVDVAVPMNKTVTGTHDVYVRNDGDGKGMFHTIQFLADIAGVEEVEIAPIVDNNIYNIAGQKVGENYKGIVIKNGRKMLVK